MTDTKTSECPFCDLIRDNKAKEIHRTGIFHFEPLNPVTPGHQLFVSRDHLTADSIQGNFLGSALLGLVFDAATRYANEPERLDDYNLIINVGSHASQTIPHLHVHYIPRRAGDGLILPWTNQYIPVACDYIVNGRACENRKAGHQIHYNNSGSESRVS